MRILHTVAFYEPYKGGSEEVVRRISELLAMRGHDVTVATAYHRDRSWGELNNVKVRSFKVAGNSVRGFSGEVKRFQEFVRTGDFDIIMNYSALAWPTDLTFPLLQELRAKKYIAPVGYSKLHKRPYRAYFAALPGVLSQYDGIIYNSVNYQDWQFGELHNLSQKAIIIPNGASEEEFGRLPGEFRRKYGISAAHIFLCVANHYFAKGHQFVIDAFRMAAPKDSALVIIGTPPHSHSWYSCAALCRFAARYDRRIHLFGNLPREDVVAAYKDAELFLFGSRVECSPLVMYESFAAGIPFVTRNVGNVIDHKDALRIVETPDDMAKEISQYLDDPHQYRETANRALALFHSAHTWERIVDKFEAIYQE